MVLQENFKKKLKIFENMGTTLYGDDASSVVSKSNLCGDNDSSVVSKSNLCGDDASSVVSKSNPCGDDASSVVSKSNICGDDASSVVLMRDQELGRRIDASRNAYFKNFPPIKAEDLSIPNSSFLIWGTTHTSVFPLLLQLDRRGVQNFIVGVTDRLAVKNALARLEFQRFRDGRPIDRTAKCRA